MVSIITCTNKPNQMENIFNNYSQQEWKEKELIIILNRNDMKIKKWKQKAVQYTNVSVYQLPAKVSLGECLNFAVKKAKYDIIAKFDDDDYYSPFYIPQAIRAFKESEADIIGKSQLFTYFQNSQKLGLRQSLNSIGGGTIMFRKEIFKKVQFPPRNTGEDSLFLRRAKKRGLKIYETDKYNYCYIKSSPKKHTWKVSEKTLLKMCSDVIYTVDYKNLVTYAF